jgi:transposase-like protein
MEKRSKAETEKFYRDLVAEHEQSGLTARAFAAARGIPAGTLSCWRHQIKKRDALAEARKSKKATKPRFVPVSVVGPETVATPVAQKPSSSAKPAGASTVYEVRLGRDRVLRLPADFDEARVAALVRAVASC